MPGFCQVLTEGHEVAAQRPSAAPASGRHREDDSGDPCEQPYNDDHGRDSIALREDFPMSTRGLDVTALRCRLTSERPPRQKVNNRRSTLKICWSLVRALGVILAVVLPPPGTGRPSRAAPGTGPADSPPRMARLTIAFAISLVVTSDCCPGPRRRNYSLFVNVARYREQLMLEFSEKPLARASAVASACGSPDTHGHDRSVAGWRGFRMTGPAHV